MRTSQLAVALAFVGSILVFAGSASRADTTDELYAMAKQEKHLVLYGGGPVEPFERGADRCASAAGIKAALQLQSRE